MSAPPKSLSEVHFSIDTPKSPGLWKKTAAFIGPAYLISVGYMDPGNWATDIAGGSKFGYSLIWVLLLSNLMALLLQSLSVRLGIVRGLDLAQVSRAVYPKFINIPLYVLAEIAIAATDLAEVIGMAIGLKLLFGLPVMWGVLITAFDTILVLFLMNRGIRMMELFISSMLFTIGMAFFFEMFIVKPDMTEIVQGFVPSELGGEALYIAIGIIGATVMPHNLYLHSSLVQTRKIEQSKKGIKEALKFNFIDTGIALNLAFFVNAAILILAATAFHKNGFHNIADIEDAHKLLKSIFGSLAPALFAVALIASGQSSTITGTLAGQIVMEGYLNLRIRPWLRRLITRLMAVVPAIAAIVYYGEHSLGNLLIFSQVILSLQLGFAVVPLIHFCCDREQMKTFVIKSWIKYLAWISAVIIVCLNIKLVFEEVSSWLQAYDNVPLHIYAFIFITLTIVAYLLFYISFVPFFRKIKTEHINFTTHKSSGHTLKINKAVYKKIAVALDFSSVDDSVISFALSSADKYAEYLFIHVIESPGAEYYKDDIFDHETRSDRERLESYLNQLDNMGYNAKMHLGYGNPADAICRAVNNFGADLLVMGSHGHRGFKDIALGTTIDAVRHRVKISVLVVRDKEAGV